MRSKNTGIVAKRQRAVTKAATVAMRHCVKGCGKGKPGANFCVECGTALPIAAGSVAKNAPVPAPAPVTDPLWFGHSADNDPDPVVREAAWQRQFNDLVAKSQAIAADNSPLLGDPSSADPAERERAWRQAYEHATKGWDRQ
ncbi:hypothetical protein [Streptomyces hokutonensis]|uniref:hypothetical protein n=1 Tax=Streptomyces hokutonensis TaxID=1306990 RepID=UPI00036999B4|nr:hypothetical protein [Streptomyces hokutonensis]